MTLCYVTLDISYLFLEIDFKELIFNLIQFLKHMLLIYLLKFDPT